MSMHNLPSALFRSEDHRNPQSERGGILPSANLGFSPLHPHNVGKLRSYVLCYRLEVNKLAISELGCGTLHSRSDLLPSTHGRAQGVSEAYVFLMGEHHLHGFRIPFDELAQRELTLLNYFVKIIYRSHLDTTSIDGTSSFPKATTHLLPVAEALKLLALFTDSRRRGLLGSSHPAP
jgi:hypothetical protein